MSLQTSDRPIRGGEHLKMFVFFLFSSILISANAYLKEPCSKYGCPLAPPIHEPFVPAPPGYTPNCAKPGLTFCESLDQYPQQLIKFLIENRNVDFDKFLRDESSEDFNALRPVSNDDNGYDYPKPNTGPGLYPQNSPFLPPAQPAFNVPLNVTNKRYLPSATNPFFTHSASATASASASASASAYASFGYQQYLSGQQRPQYQSPQFFNPNQNPWPQRNSREADEKQQLTARTVYENPLLEFTSNSRSRAKRQSDANTISICPTRTMSILPKAAINNQGNWMYVVNIDTKEKYSQLVRSEICVTETCDGICSLPLGYTSKCKQQYVQKRLIALGGNGENLYNDVFWIPSGCSCQVTLDY